jgi:uncharacterized protein YggE
VIKRLKVLSVVALLALVLAACTNVQATPTAEPQVVPTAAEPQAVPTAAPPEAQRVITVVGVGRVSLVPDIAKINIGVETRASTVSEAKATVDKQMESISATLTGLGVTEKDVQTSYYSIYYEQEPYQPSAREGETAAEPKGAYRVSSMLEVTVRDVEKAGEVLDAVVAAGANQVQGVNFTVSDDEKWQSEAREKAVANARVRAEEFATLAGVSLGEVLSVSEVIGGAVPYVAYADRGMGGGGGFAPGELEMSTQVQVTFAIQ